MQMSKPTVRLILTRGLPGSGKSTWAKQQIEKQDNYRRVNRDDLRNMFGVYDDFCEGRERAVTAAEEAAAAALLLAGYTVIVDDCNLNPQYQRRWQQIADDAGVDLIVQDFTDVPLRECLKRNAQRTGSARVGNKVIHTMYEKWIAPEKMPEVDGAEKAIICDLDGTLALIGQRNPYDASHCDTLDRLNEPVAQVVKKFARDGYHLIFMSGRSNRDEAATRRFLKLHGFGGDDARLAFDLYMRDARDHRPDTVVKRELFDRYVRGNWNIAFCIDDRDSIVDLWRSMGLVCFQVGEGWF